MNCTGARNGGAARQARAAKPTDACIASRALASCMNARVEKSTRWPFLAIRQGNSAAPGHSESTRCPVCTPSR